MMEEFFFLLHDSKVLQLMLQEMTNDKEKQRKLWCGFFQQMMKNDLSSLSRRNVSIREPISK